MNRQDRPRCPAHLEGSDQTNNERCNHAQPRNGSRPVGGVSHRHATEEAPTTSSKHLALFGWRHRQKDSRVSSSREEVRPGRAACATSFRTPPCSQQQPRPGQGNWPNEPACWSPARSPSTPTAWLTGCGASPRVPAGDSWASRAAPRRDADAVDCTACSELVLRYFFLPALRSSLPPRPPRSVLRWHGP